MKQNRPIREEYKTAMTNNLCKGSEQYDKTELVIHLFLEGISIKQALEDNQLSAYKFAATLSACSELHTMYGRAKEVLADVMVSSMNTIADEEPDVNRAKVKIDAIKWQASKYKHKEYGDRLHLDGAVLVDLSQAIADGRKRALERDITEEAVLLPNDKQA